MSRITQCFVFVCGAGMAACAPQSPASEEASEISQAIIGPGSFFASMNLPAGMGAAPGNVQLLMDGTVLASGETWSSSWWILKPNQSGGYANGLWVPAPTSILGRYANPSSILRDGRYWEAGGEYTANGSAHKSNRDQAEVYDPVAATWSALPNDPFSGGLEDAPAALLADGVHILAGPTRYDGHIRMFDTNSETWSLAASAPSGQSGEGGSILLRDGRVLSGSHKFALYQPDTNSWVRTQDTTPVSDAFAVEAELGPMLMLLDGRVLVLGANSHNGLYSPDSDSWQMAADTPQGLGHSDTVAAVEPNGRVLAVSTEATDGTGSTTFHEYSPSDDAWLSVPGPSGMGAAGHVRMLPLPSLDDPTGVGQVMVTGGGGKAWFYKPSTNVDVGYRATLTSVWVAFGKFHVAGTQLNGLTNGADVGDDAKMQTNFPIAWLVDLDSSSLFPYFVRAFDVDQMAPRAATDGVFSFQILEPFAGWANGSWEVHVAASGLEAVNYLSLSVTNDRGWGFVPLLQL